MNGITFGSYHSYRVLNVILTEKTINAPEIRTQTVEIPGADGLLDFTEAFGGVKYANRQLSFSFECIEPYDDFYRIFSDIQSRIHGQKLAVSLDDDPAFYYTGRISVDSWKTDRRVGRNTVDVDADPSKYQKDRTVLRFAVNAAKTVYLPNLMKPVIPVITVSAPMDISFNGTVYHFTEENAESSALVLSGGVNKLEITGTGNIRFDYREASL